MKRWLPWIITALFAAWMVSALRPKPEKEFHTREFGKLPVLLNGRIQPFDSVARNSLLQIRAKQSVALEGRNSLSATEWLLEVMMKPEIADDRKCFRIDHPEVLAGLKLSESEKHFSFNQLKPSLEEVDKQARRISGIESQQRTQFERQLMKLSSALTLYSRLKISLRPESSDDFARELERFQTAIGPGMAAIRAQSAGKEFDAEALETLSGFVQQYSRVNEYAYPLVVPPENPELARDGWMNAGANLMQALRGGNISPAMAHFAAMAAAFRQNEPTRFNAALSEYQSWLRQKFVPELGKARREFAFNDFQPFYKTTILYVFALVLALFGSLMISDWLRRSSFNLVTLAWIVHTAGLIARMVLEGRPPVTNLYSSAVFIGWGAVLLGLILERVYPIGVGLLTATIAGFSTQIIAHNLALGGDTMEMMRAVLDTNFWLATHVVVITLGYSATFVAGLLALAYVLLGVFTPTLSQRLGATDVNKALAKMVYGIICFATLFSFAGTVLGGIWADQSWGRFWGWDPKENGALILVIWNAVILHARWGKMVKERGLMNMAIVGNMVTAFSWFGVNMLGVGLHSYGFMDSAFKWLMIFDASQVAIILLGLLPLSMWRSFRVHTVAALKPSDATVPVNA
jgi:ABC-type transport system involved in cytochrome c biogenesis permease subunit